jgi:hypothetical protein
MNGPCFKKSMTFLQFGEAANGSMVHLWNYLSLTHSSGNSKEFSSDYYNTNDTAGDSASETESKVFFTSEQRPNALIYSEKRSLKGILTQDSLQEPITEQDASKLANQKTGHWTDLNYVTKFPEASYRECSEFDASRGFLAAFYDSKTKASFLDQFEEDVRKRAEASDWMEKFNLITQNVGSIGAATLHSLEYLNDEFAKTAKMVISFSERIKIESTANISWENCDRFDGSIIGSALKTALTHNAIVEEHVSFVPLAEFSKSDLEPFNGVALKDPREAFRFFSSLHFALFADRQIIPTNGGFGSLLASTPNFTFNLTNEMNSSQSALMKLKRTPLATYNEREEYEFESVDMSAQVNFDQSVLSSKASNWLNTINRPRALWQELEAAGVSNELAGGDYYNEFIETLHQIKDLALYEHD